MSSNKEHYHNKGQEDAHDRDYDPPHGVADSLTTWSDSGMERNREENRAYDDGYYHSRGQDDSNDGRYRPPSDSNDREAYDAGYDNAKESSKKGCFLTSACVDFAGLDDNCEELSELRRFRDTFVSSMPGGTKMIAEYYRLAPVIVARIQKSLDRDSALKETLFTIRNVVACIKAGDQQEAVDLYCSMFLRLRKRYLG